MLFITNREPKGSIRTRKNRHYKFDLNKNAPSNSIYCCERLGVENYIELGSSALMTRLKESHYKQLLFFYTRFFKFAGTGYFSEST